MPPKPTKKEAPVESTARAPKQGWLPRVASLLKKTPSEAKHRKVPKKPSPSPARKANPPVKEPPKPAPSKNGPPPPTPRKAKPSVKETAKESSRDTQAHGTPPSQKTALYYQDSTSFWNPEFAKGQ